MYLQKVISKKIKKRLIFVGVLKVTDEKAGSEFISQRYRSADPDPYQNVSDQEHCCTVDNKRTKRKLIETNVQ